MTDETNPAGTPPANPPEGGNNQIPPTPPAQQPGQNPPGDGNIWTPAHQEIFDRRFAEKMGVIEKDLGIQPGGLKDFVAAQKKAKQAPPQTGETLTGADLKIARMEALMTAGVPSKQIPLLLQHLNIAGKTREEIQRSIQQLIELKLLSIETTPAPQPGIQQQTGTPNAAQGAGNPGVPGTPGKKTWKKSEIQAVLRDPAKSDPTVLAEINLAQKEGRVDYNL